MLGLRTQDANTRGMECAHPHLPGYWPNNCRHSLAHFLRRLVGKRDCQDVHRVRARCNEMPDALREYASFARASAGYNK